MIERAAAVFGEDDKLNLMSFFVAENANDHFQRERPSGILEEIHILSGIEALSPCPKICYEPS